MRRRSYDDVIKHWVHNPADEAWKDEASCQGTSPELWFPVRDGRRHDPVAGVLTKMAKLICLECPVQRECLAWALVTGEKYGIYGGLTERERARLTGKKRA